MNNMVLFDAAEDVLLRLPVKDIIRCKSVCKSWYSLISSRYFVQTHVKFICNKQQQQQQQQLGNRRIAMTRRYTMRFGNMYKVPIEWDYYHLLRIEGSSNGLLCISSYGNRICLTNPSTREFRKLPKPPILPKNAQRYGFGYDSSTHDYKLVMAINQGCDGALVQVLSLKSNVWKLFGHINYRFDSRTPGILFNAALHWFLYDVNRDNLFIVSFDLATEEFTEIPQPNDDSLYVGSYRNKLGIFQDRLCIHCTAKDGLPYGIWVMNRYNVRESWERLPNGCEMKDRVHYMIRDCLHSWKMPAYFCSDDTFLSRTGKYISSPFLVQTLVSPFVNQHGRPSEAKRYKRAAKEAGSSKKWRDFEEAHALKDGEKNAFHHAETHRKRRKRKRGRK